MIEKILQLVILELIKNEDANNAKILIDRLWQKDYTDTILKKGFF